MNPLARLFPFAVLTLTLAGCAAGGSDPVRAQSAYDKACRSIYMTKAAAQEARWCWEAVGATSYEEWAALERPETLERRATVARAMTAQ